MSELTARRTSVQVSAGLLKWPMVLGSWPLLTSVQSPSSPRVIRKMGLGAWAAKLVLPHFAGAWRNTLLGSRFAVVIALSTSNSLPGAMLRGFVLVVVMLVPLWVPGAFARPVWFWPGSWREYAS